MDYKVGDLLTVSQGQYSDYCVRGLFRVIKPFSKKDVGVHGYLAPWEIEEKMKEHRTTRRNHEHWYKLADEYSRKGCEWEASAYLRTGDEALLEELNDHVKHREWLKQSFSCDRLCATLVRLGFLEELDYQELHEDDLKKPEDF